MKSKLQWIDIIASHCVSMRMATFILFFKFSDHIFKFSDHIFKFK